MNVIVNNNILKFVKKYLIVLSVIFSMTVAFQEEFEPTKTSPLANVWFDLPQLSNELQKQLQKQSGRREVNQRYQDPRTSIDKYNVVPSFIVITVIIILLSNDI